MRAAGLKVNPDGTPESGVHALFVVSGRVNCNGNASNCNIAQDDFAAHLAHHNLSMRIRRPTYRSGLVEASDSSTRTANLAAHAQINSRVGITGRFNHSGNTGTVTRFGWSAQDSSALMFAGEAYNVEMGITNELCPIGRDETPGCATAVQPPATPA